MSSLPMRFAAVAVPNGVSNCAALAERWLCAEEAMLCAPRAVEKRRAEFIAGRIAAKIAVSRLRGTVPLDDVPRIAVEIGATSGRPVVVDRLGVPVAGVGLSITHSNCWAIAAAGQAALGVDLVPIEDRGGAFAAEAFAPGELEAWVRWMPSCQTPAFAQSIAFGAKEGVLKWRGVGLRMGLQELTTTPSRSRGRVYCPDLDLWALAFRIRVELRPYTSCGGHGRGVMSLAAWVMRLGDQLLVAVIDVA